MMLTHVITSNEKMVLASDVDRSIIAQARGDKHAFRCPSCLEPVLFRISGLGHIKCVAHFPLGAEAIECEFRTQLKKGYFFERNLTGEPSTWHKLVAEQISYVLENSMNITVEHEPSYGNPVERKPDLAFSFKDQKYHVEIQHSPTSRESIDQRISRDMNNGVVTLWIVNSSRLNVETQLDRTWYGDIAIGNGGVLWGWSEECFADSKSASMLIMDRLVWGEKAGEFSKTNFADHLPTIEYFTHKESYDRGQMSIGGINIPDQLKHDMQNIVKNKHSKYGETYTICQFPVLINVPFPCFGEPVKVFTNNNKRPHYYTWQQEKKRIS
jgi:hypothetical protein